LYCGGNSLEQRFQGLRHITVPGGCRAITKSFIFDGSASVFGDTIDVDNKILDGKELLGEDLHNRVVKLTYEELDHLSLVGSRRGLNIRDIAAEFDRQDGTQIFHFGLGGVMLVLVISIACICVLRYRHLRKRITEKGRTWWNRPARSARDIEMKERERDIIEPLSPPPPRYPIIHPRPSAEEKAEMERRAAAASAHYQQEMAEINSRLCALGQD
jgi:hypothetical protein